MAQSKFLALSGLSVFKDNIMSIIEENELVTSAALVDLNSEIDAIKKHNHDDDYAALGHNHDTVYAKLAHGNHVPATQTANNKVFLRNDNTWATITPANIGAATASHTHSIESDNLSGTLESILESLNAAIAANAEAISANAEEIANKADAHAHPYYNINDSRTKNTVLAAPNGINGVATFRSLVSNDIPNLAASKITSGTFDISRIPDLAASKITSGTFDISRIPTGETSTTVALGNHSHSIFSDTKAANFFLAGPISGNATVPGFRKITIQDLPTGTDADNVALGNHTHSGYAAANHGEHITNDDQEWCGVKTFVDGIRIGSGDDPEDNTMYESNRTIYFGDSEYAYITEIPHDQLTLKGNKINILASGTLTSKAIFPETTNYKPNSLPSKYTVSNTRYSNAVSFSRYCSKSTFATVGESSYNLYINGSTEFYGVTVSPGYTVEFNVGAGYITYRDDLWIDSGYECPDCGNLVEYTVQPFLDSTGGTNHRIRYYLTESSSSTTPISGTTADININVDGYTSLNQLNIGGSATYCANAKTIKYTNTGTSYKTVYLKGKLLRPASSAITISSAESGYWRWTMEEGSSISPSLFAIYLNCGHCGASFDNDMLETLWDGIGSGKTFYTHFRNITTCYKYTTYKTNTAFSLPSFDMSDYGPVAVLGNGIVSGPGTSFDSANLASTDKGLINTTTQLCYKFVDTLSGFLVDSNQLSYISGARTDVSICPSRIFDITSGNGLTFAQGNSRISPDYMFNTRNGKITLGYYSGSSNYTVEFDYYGIKTPDRSGSFTLGSSTNRLGTIYSTSQINTSDERFKNWISDIDIDFEKLKKIPKKLFTWRDSFLKDDDDIHIGTSAQAIRDIYPEIVHVYNNDVELCVPRDIYDPDAVLAIEYDKLGVIALAAIDKLHEENIELKNKLSTIENENNELKNRLNTLEELLKTKGII